MELVMKPMAVVYARANTCPSLAAAKAIVGQHKPLNLTSNAGKGSVLIVCIGRMFQSCNEHRMHHTPDMVALNDLFLCEPNTVVRDRLSIRKQPKMGVKGGRKVRND